MVIAVRVGVALLAAAALLGALAGAVSARAQEPDAAATLGLEVVAGYGGRSTGGAWLPVEVRLAPERPIRARLVLTTTSSSGTPLRVVRDVEAAAAATSVYRTLLPAGGGLRVRLEEEGREAVVVRPEVPNPEDGWLIGTLGDAPARPPAVRDEATAATGVWVGVDPAWLAASVEALEPLGTLVVPAAALAELDEEARRNLAAGVTAGTDLVVTAEAEGPVDLGALGLDDLPAIAAREAAGQWLLDVDGPAWTYPSPLEPRAAAVDVGRGRVTVVAATPEPSGDTALWSAVAAPGSRGTAPPSDWDVNRNAYQLTRLLANPDSDTPAIPWLAGFLVAYVVVVGPVNAVVLARARRRELAWITIPVVTAVFTVAAAVGATGGTAPLGLQARAVAWLDGVGREIAVVGLRAATPGTRSAVLPGPGWAITTAAEGVGGVDITTAADTTIAVELAALQLGPFTALRATAEPAPLEVTAVAGDEGTAVEVRNVGAVDLDGVVVRAGTASRALGRLAAGASATAELPTRRLRPVDPYRDLVEGLGGVDDSGSAAPPASLEALLRASLVDASPGVVWAVATTAEGTGAARIGGGAEDRGTLYAVGERVTLPEDGTVAPMAVNRALFADDDGYRPSPQAVDGLGEAHLRFRLPAGGQVEQLHEDLNRGLGAAVDVAVWEPATRRFLEREEAFPGGVANPARFVDPLGQVVVRVSGQLTPFDASGRSVSGIAVEPGLP